MTAILEQQLNFALERLCNVCSETSEDGFAKQISQLKVTLKKIRAKFQYGEAKSSCYLDDLLAKKILLGVMTGIVKQNEQDGSSDESTDESSFVVPVGFATSLVVELGITDKFVKHLLKENNTSILCFIERIVSVTDEVLVPKAFSIITELIGEFLSPSICYQIWKEDFVSLRDARIEISNLMKAVKNALMSLNLPRNGSSIIQASFSLLEQRVKNSGIKFLKIKHLLFQCFGDSVRADFHAIFSETNKTTPIASNAVEILPPRTPKESSYNPETKPSFSFLAKHLKTVEDFANNSKNSRVLEGTWHTIGRGDSVGKALDVMDLTITSAFFQYLYPEILSTLKQSMVELSETNLGKQCYSKETCNIVGIIESIHNLVASESQDFADILNLEELLLVLTCGEISVWHSLENRILSAKEKQIVLEELQETMSSVCTVDVLSCCCQKLDSKHDVETDKESYIFWNQICKIIIQKTTLQEANQLFSQNILICSPNQSLFWNETDLSCKEDLLSDTRTLLNQMTIDDYENMRLLSQHALQAPFDVLSLVINRGMTSSAEASLCVQILDTIWGLKCLLMRDFPDLPAVLYILRDALQEQTAFQRATTAVIIRGLMESPVPRYVTIWKIIDLLVLPHVNAHSPQKYLNISIFIIQQLSLADDTKLLSGVSDVVGLCRKLCSCLIACVDLLTSPGNVVLNTIQRGILKPSTNRIQRLVSLIITKRLEESHDIFALLNNSVDLGDCWQALYLIDILRVLGREKRIQLPPELDFMMAYGHLKGSDGDHDLVTVLTMLFKVTYISGSYGVQLCTRLCSLEGISWKYVILAVHEVLTLMDEDDIKNLCFVLFHFLSIASCEQLYALLPRWMPKSCSRDLLEKAGLVSIMAHTTMLLFNETGHDFASLSDRFRKYSWSVKIGFLEGTIKGGNIEESCLLTIVVLQQSLLLSSYLDREDDESHALCLELVNSYLDFVKTLDDKDQALSLCGSLHGLIKKIPKLSYRSILIQRITSFLTSL